jgi:hypothetical protein
MVSYLFCGSKGVFNGHILNVIDQSVIWQYIFILVDFVHSIFEGQLCWRLLLVL